MNYNLKEVKISGIRKFYNEVQKIDGAISLTLGQPDFQLPISVRNGLINAINNNQTTYTSNAGIEELRNEISNYLKKININFHKDEICITVGGSEALFSIFTALINKEDKVLIPTPSYPAYESIIKILGGDVINYSLKSDFRINISEIEMIIKSNNIKYLVLSLPSNPTGAILSKDERDELIRVIYENDILVITDEIYESLCYEEYYSIAQCEKIKDKVIYINGFSKMFSMTGLRVGYFACCKDIMNELMKVHQYNVSCAASISQYAAYEGLRNGLDEVRYMKSIFNSRKEYVTKRLTDMKLNVVIPKGAFYVFPSIKEFNMSSEEFAMRLLTEEKVACVPGNAFGIGGEGYIRISYCNSNEELKMGLDGIERFINKLRKAISN